MALLMLTLAILIGTPQQELVTALKEGTQQINRWSGAILLVVGVWLIALSIWARFLRSILSCLALNLVCEGI